MFIHIYILHQQEIKYREVTLKHDTVVHNN